VVNNSPGYNQMDENERDALQEWVDTLSAEKAEEGLLVSLYVPPAEKERAMRMVASELTLASNIRNRVVRQLVSSSLKDVLRTMTYPLGHRAVLNGFAVFANGVGVARLVAPPEPILGFEYRCEKTYYLTPFLEMLVPRHVTALVVMERGAATLGWTDGRRIVMLLNIESYITGKHSKGGMSVNRWARQIQEETEAFYAKVGEKANAIFMPMLDRIERLVVGGPALTKGKFVEGDYLDYRLRDKLDPSLHSTGYVEEQGLRELCARAGLLAV
jgi:peptide chain release factor subunit 1